jgi:hypothetical protein
LISLKFGRPGKAGNVATLFCIAPCRFVIKRYSNSFILLTSIQSSISTAAFHTSTHFTGSVDLLHSSTSGANTMHLIQLYDKSPYEIRYLANLFRLASHSHVRNRLVYRNIKHAAKSILNPRDILITVVLISSTALKVCS